MTWLGRSLVVPIRAYQAWRAGRPSACRFTPSCSTYAIEALEVCGTSTALRLIARRLARCRPGGGCGFDPVPIDRADRSGKQYKVANEEETQLSPFAPFPKVEV